MSDICNCPHPTDKLTPLFSARDHVTGERFTVGYCARCKLHVTSPTPTEAEIARYYPPAYYGNGRRFAYVVEWLLSIIYRYRVWEMERRQPPGKALDIGCGRGLMLHRLRSHSWQVQGTELSEGAAAYARDALRIPITVGKLHDAHFPDAEFDLIIMWHVIEHLHNPREVLAEVRRILKPGGRLLLAAPNFGSWEARWGREDWFHLDVPKHLTHFTPKSLKRLLREAGFRVERKSFFSTEYDFFTFAQTALNKLGFPYNRLYNMLRTQSARMNEHVDSKRSALASLAEDALMLCCAAPLLAAGMVIAPFAAALDKGATFALIALKPKD